MPPQISARFTGPSYPAVTIPAAACDGDWRRWRERYHAAARSCTCHNASWPKDELSWS